jgi:hypothetical protein
MFGLDRMSTVKPNHFKVGGKYILIRDILNNTSPISYYYHDISDRTWNNRNDWCEYQNTPMKIIEKIKRYHTRKWLPTTLMNLFVGPPNDQYNYNLKLKGYAETVYKVRELTFSDIHSMGLSIETMACEFAVRQQISCLIHIKRMIISNFKPSLISKISNFIYTENLLLVGIRTEHTPYHWKDKSPYRDLNLWDYWTYPVRVLHRYSHATEAVDLDTLFDNVLRNCLFCEDWLYKTIEKVDIKQSADIYYDKETEMTKRIENFYRIYARSAKTILRSYLVQNEYIKTLYNLTDSREETKRLFELVEQEKEIANASFITN